MEKVNWISLFLNQKLNVPFYILHNIISKKRLTFYVILRFCIRQKLLSLFTLICLMERRVNLYAKFSSIHIAWANFVDISKSWHTLIRVPNARVADPGENNPDPNTNHKKNQINTSRSNKISDLDPDKNLRGIFLLPITTVLQFIYSICSIYAVCQKSLVRFI